MIRTANVGLISGLVFGLCGTAHADPAFVESLFVLQVQAQVNPDALQWQLFTDDQTGGFFDHSGSVSTVSNNGGGTGVAFSSGGTAWSGSGQGTVYFGDSGFVRAAPGADSNVNLNDSGWSYTFITDDEDTFTLDYSVATSGMTTDASGLNGFTFVALQDDQVVYYQDLDLDSADEIVVGLDPGTQYTVLIFPDAELSGDIGFGIGAMNAEFDWSISAGGN